MILYITQYLQICVLSAYILQHIHICDSNIPHQVGIEIVPTYTLVPTSYIRQRSLRSLYTHAPHDKKKLCPHDRDAYIYIVINIIYIFMFVCVCVIICVYNKRGLAVFARAMGNGDTCTATSDLHILYTYIYVQYKVYT